MLSCNSIAKALLISVLISIMSEQALYLQDNLLLIYLCRFEIDLFVLF